jgi:prepilin-type N-terminal cleavage/methylation domain-containing protein
MSGSKQFGFTLAELLISLAILGVIATFTIPKLLQVQQQSSYMGIAKEAMATISGDYGAYISKNKLSTTVGTPDLTPYMNYLIVDTVSLIDDH